MAPRVSRQRGFTLIELLIVIGIIVALIGILVPSLAHAKRVAMKSAAQQQLAALQTGLAQYYTVFHIYPPSGPVMTPIATGRGGAMLAEGLVGYLESKYDGAGPSTGDGLGFRVTKNAAIMGGAIYGPYAPTDTKGYKAISATDQYFIDPWGKEILYYRSSQSLATPPFVATAVFSNSSNPNALFNTPDCSIDPSYAPSIPDPSAGSKGFFKSLSVSGNTPAPLSTLGADSFLLISAGPDGVYFTDDDIVAGKQ